MMHQPSTHINCWFIAPQNPSCRHCHHSTNFMSTTWMWKKQINFNLRRTKTVLAWNFLGSNTLNSHCSVLWITHRGQNGAVNVFSPSVLMSLKVLCPSKLSAQPDTSTASMTSNFSNQLLCSFCWFIAHCSIQKLADGIEMQKLGPLESQFLIVFPNKWWKMNLFFFLN